MRVTKDIKTMIRNVLNITDFVEENDQFEYQGDIDKYLGLLHWHIMSMIPAIELTEYTVIMIQSNFKKVKNELIEAGVEEHYIAQQVQVLEDLVMTLQPRDALAVISELQCHIDDLSRDECRAGQVFEKAYRKARRQPTEENIEKRDILKASKMAAHNARKMAWAELFSHNLNNQGNVFEKLYGSFQPGY